MDDSPHGSTYGERISDAWFPSLRAKREQDDNFLSRAWCELLNTPRPALEPRSELLTPNS